jgi:hypothetical protein
MARSMPKFGLEEIYNSVGRNPGQNGKLTGETTLIRTNSWGNFAGFWFSGQLECQTWWYLTGV